MKKIFTLFVLLNVFAMGAASAQSGYPYCNINYTFDTIAYNPAPFNAGTNVPFIGNDTFYSDSIPIGFTFNYYGYNFSELVVSPTGYITFNTSYANTHPTEMITSTGPILPGPYFPENSIYLFVGYEITNVINDTTTIKYNTTGTSPNRKFVVSFDSLNVQCNNFNYYDSTWFATGWYMSGEVILYETTNIIETQINFEPYVFYADLGGGWINTGIQNSDGTIGLQDTRGFGGVQNIAGRYTPYNAPLPAQSICIVSVDSSTGKNIIVWNQPAGVPVDSFIIYKETSQANVYAPIGTQFNSVFSTFIDTGSYPAVVSNTYRLGFRDSCGIISDTSGAHTTIHLAVSQGIGTSWNLSWNAYTGFSFPSYNIYRGTSPSTMTLLTTLNSNVFAYTDLTPPSTVYYAIEIVDSAGCNPSARMENNYSSSMSNIVNPSNTGIYELQALQHISLYPNPATTAITIHSPMSIINCQLSIIDVLGNKIYQQNISGIDNSIDVSNWSEGVYFYEIKGVNSTVRGKFVIE